MTIHKQRGARQGGFLLEPDRRINNGVARAYYPQRGGAAFTAATEPTHYLAGERQRIVLAGVEQGLVGGHTRPSPTRPKRAPPWSTIGTRSARYSTRPSRG